MEYILTAITFGVVVGSTLTFWISKAYLGLSTPDKREPDKTFKNGLNLSFFIQVFLQGGGLDSKCFLVDWPIRTSSVK